MARRERTPSGSVKGAALRMLGRRDYTSDEVVTRLVARGFEEAEVRTAVASLAEARIIDDHRAALAHVRTASRIKGRGRLRIRRELQARGADEAAIIDAMATIEPEDEATLDRPSHRETRGGRARVSGRTPETLRATAAARLPGRHDQQTPPWRFADARRRRRRLNYRRGLAEAGSNSVVVISTGVSQPCRSG